MFVYPCETTLGDTSGVINWHQRIKVNVKERCLLQPSLVAPFHPFLAWLVNLATYTLDPTYTYPLSSFLCCFWGYRFRRRSATLPLTVTPF